MSTIYGDGYGVDRMERMAQSSKEKQQDFRARMTLLGMTEVRGVYLPPELHSELKEHARRLLERHALREQQPNLLTQALGLGSRAATKKGDSE